MKSTKIQSKLIDSKEITLLRTIPSEQLIQNWKNQFNIDITKEIKGHKNVYLYQCNQTKLKFFEPPDVAGSNKVYEQLEKFDWYYMPQKWEHDIAIQDLDGCHQILEVGCGKGYFIERLCRDLNLDAQGIELNTSAVAYAVERGIPVTQIDLDDLSEKKPNYFDAVCTFQVLEHIAEPQKFLSSLIKLVKPGGKLIVAVPNAKCFTQYSKDNLLDLPPHHMSQWCQDTFEALTSIFPLRVLQFRFEPLAEYHVDWYVSIQLSRLPQYKLLRSLSFRFAYHIIKPFLKKIPALRNLIKGHTIYVCFEKNSPES